MPPAEGYEAPKRFQENPALIWQKRYYWLLAFSGVLIPYAIAGWDGVLLAGFFRMAFGWHVIWSVNSLCHIFGSHATKASGKAYDTRKARNFPLWCFFSILALLSGGEFWHANHHAQQKSAYLGWRWFELDPGKWVVWILEKLGLVQDITLPQAIE